ncbi:MAG: hypothetical protein ACRDO1_02105 [Nocardioidaceae bacterium]
MTDDSTGADRPETRSAPPERRSPLPESRSASPARERRVPVSMRQVRDGTNAVRSRIGTLVRMVAYVCAAILALGALLVALEANPDNSVVQWLKDGADTLAGPLGDLFTFERDDGTPHPGKNALVNWGIAAVAYLVAGRIVERIIKP